MDFHGNEDEGGNRANSMAFPNHFDADYLEPSAGFDVIHNHKPGDRDVDPFWHDADEFQRPTHPFRHDANEFWRDAGFDFDDEDIEDLFFGLR